jgi:hypothetical protein
MPQDDALLPPRIAILSKVAAHEPYLPLRLDRLLDAERRVIYQDTYVDDGKEHPDVAMPFEDVPRYVAFAARDFGDGPDVAAYYDDDRDDVVTEMLTTIDELGFGGPVRDHRVADQYDMPLACLDLDTGAWVHLRRTSLLHWEATAPALDLAADVTFHPVPEPADTRPAPLCPETVELTESEAARVRAAELAATEARHAAHTVADACARAALERAGVNVPPAYLTRHRETTVSREVPLRFQITTVDSREAMHTAYLSIRCAGGRLLQTVFCMAGLTTEDAVLTELDLRAVASVLNLPVRDRYPFGPDDDSDGGEDNITPTRYGRAGDDGLVFEADRKVSAGHAPMWTVRWEGGTPPAGVWLRVAAVLEAKGVPVTPTEDGLHVAMVYRPTAANE